METQYQKRDKWQREYQEWQRRQEYARREPIPPDTAFNRFMWSLTRVLTGYVPPFMRRTEPPPELHLFDAADESIVEWSPSLAASGVILRLKRDRVGDIWEDFRDKSKWVITRINYKDYGMLRVEAWGIPLECQQGQVNDGNTVSPD